MYVDDLIADAGVFPQQLDLHGRRVLFVKLPEARIREAAFLDDRVLGGDVLASWVPLDALEAASPPDRPLAPLWIFHIGHCGSTLLSRLLPAVAPLLPIREPTVLRTLAHARRGSGGSTDLREDEWLGVFELMVSLLSRGHRPGEPALIKATSDCNNLIAPALSRSAASRAVLMYVSLRSYLATMIVDGVPRPDVDGHVESRLRDLRPFLDDPNCLAPGRLLPPGQRAAIVWLSGVVQLGRARDALEGSVMTLDFDDFLQDAAGNLAGAAHFLGLPDDGRAVAGAIGGPIMRTYAKAPDHAYTPASRIAQLRENYARSAEQIDEGLRWADTMATSHAGIAEALSRFPFRPRSDAD
jgi:hypothetical protein